MIIYILNFNSRHPDSRWQRLVIAQQVYKDLFDRFSVKKRQFLGGQRPPHNLQLSRGPLIYLEKAFGRPRDPGVASGCQKVIQLLFKAPYERCQVRRKLIIFTSPIGHLRPSKDLNIHQWLQQSYGEASGSLKVAYI